MTFTSRAGNVVGRALGSVTKKAISRPGRQKPLPLASIRRFRRLLPGSNPLAPTFKQVRATSSSLNNSVLATSLSGEELGTWSLGPRTINMLEQRIRERRPRYILELGSGISTLCLAQFMTEMHGPDEGPRVVSVEQSDDAASKTRALLERFDLARNVHVITRPLAEQTVLDREALCYDLSDLATELPGAPEFVLIDGPSGERGVRFATLPLLLPHLSDGCVFILDDALRDAELEIAHEWARTLPVTIEGLVPMETGVLIGTVKR